ncbi:MAG: phosphoserine phosphatase SerB, partial [Pseudomonadota bacterium]
MPPILTLVAADNLTDKMITMFGAIPGAGTADRLGTRAVDISFEKLPDRAQIAALAHTHRLDFALQSGGNRRKKLLLADMDSTMIEQECLDELADFAGVGAEVATVTERAMRGELDFEEALTERVARLEGLSADTCNAVLRDRLTLSAGAVTLIATMKAHGARTVLVSGGFDIFVDAIAARCGFQNSQANRLEVDGNGKLTGRVIPPILGREAKA